jgi:hypothetical protein
MRPRWIGAAVATCAIAAALTAAVATRAASRRRAAGAVLDREPGLPASASPLPERAPEEPARPVHAAQEPVAQERAPEEPVRPAPARAVVPSGPAAPASVGGPERAPARARIEKGVLVVRVEPWAEVWIDGAPAGQTPVQVTVRTGAHRVLLKDDHRQKTVTVSVIAARETVIEEVW